MTLDQFIASALPEPTGGIALLILIIYAVTFVLQRFVGERLPNEGEISTIALSLTAFVLSLYMLIAAWTTSNESVYSIGIAQELRGVLSEEGVPLIASIGIYISPVIALLTSIFTFIHFLMMVGISIQLVDRDFFAQIMAACTLLGFAIIIVIFSPDLPIVFLAMFIGNRALKSLANIFDKSIESSLDVIFDRLSNFTTIVLICVVFLKYRVWHEDIFRNIPIHFSLGAINLKWGMETSITREISPIGFGILLITLISALLINVWLRSFRLFQYMSDSRVGNIVLWGYGVVWSSIGLFLLLRWGRYLPENMRWVFIVIGGLLSLRALWGMLNTWKVHQFFMMGLLIKAGFVIILVGLHQQTISFLMFISWITAGVLVAFVASMMSAPLSDFLRNHGLAIYHPEEELTEKISSGDVRYMRGMRQRSPLIFWLFSFTLAVLVGVPLTLQYNVLMEFFSQLYVEGNFSSKVVLIFVLMISIASCWGLGKYWGLLVNGENIINRIQRPKDLKNPVWSTRPEEKLTGSLINWRVWIVILLLGLMNVFFWFSYNPLTIDKSWSWVLFLETSVLPIYWLHIVWFLAGAAVFTLAVNKYRNKTAVSLLKK